MRYKIQYITCDGENHKTEFAIIEQTNPTYAVYELENRMKDKWPKMVKIGEPKEIKE